MHPFWGVVYMYRCSLEHRILCDCPCKRKGLFIHPGQGVYPPLEAASFSLVPCRAGDISISILRVSQFRGMEARSPAQPPSGLSSLGRGPFSLMHQTGEQGHSARRLPGMQLGTAPC